MLKYSIYIVVIYIACVPLFGCADSGGSWDKNTNWLKNCEYDDDCGNGLSCLCHICSETCESKSDCDGLNANASCVSVKVETLASACATANTKPEGNMCLMPCLVREDCSSLRSELVCVNGSCVSSGSDAGPFLDGSKGGVDTSNEPNDASTKLDVSDGYVGDDGDFDATNEPSDSSVDGNVVIFDASDDGHSFSYVTEPGTTSDVLVSGISTVKDLLPGDDGYLYWVEWGTLDSLGNSNSDGAIRRIPKDGGGIETVVDRLELPWRLYMDSDNFYWLSGCYDPPASSPTCDGSGGYSLWAMPRNKSSDPVMKVWGLEVSADNPLILGTDAWFWVENTSSAGTVLSTIWSYNKSRIDFSTGAAPFSSRSDHGNEILTITNAGGENLALFGSDEGYVYYAIGTSSINRASNQNLGIKETIVDCCGRNATLSGDYIFYIGTDNKVAKIPKIGGSVTNLGEAVGPLYISADSNHVYTVSDYWDGTYVMNAFSIEPGSQSKIFTWPKYYLPAWTAGLEAAWVYAENSIVRITVQ
jgi:hypothetical protein